MPAVVVDCNQSNIIYTKSSHFLALRLLQDPREARTRSC